MKDRIQHRLKRFDSKSDVNADSYVKVDLSGERMLIPPGEINHVVNVGEQFDKERNEASTYRFTFTVSPLFSNPLCNMDGITDYNFSTQGNGTTTLGANNGLISLASVLFREDPYDGDFSVQPELSFGEAYNKHFKELDGWFGFYDPDPTRPERSTFNDFEPSRKRFDLNSNIVKNWDIMLTYPAEVDDTDDMVVDGLIIVNQFVATVGNRQMLGITTSTHHGLSNGDRVRISNSNVDGDYAVVRLGDDEGVLFSNHFVIDIDPTSASVVNGRMRRLVNGEPSRYYFRKFKKLILNDNDYEVYPLAFSKTIYNDQMYQIVINEDVDIAGLTDNLGRPLSEVFLTFIKTDSSNMFRYIKAGLDLEFDSGNINFDVYNIRQITEATGSETALPAPNVNRNVEIGQDSFYGDLVEYNRFELKENVLAEVLHRFNTVDRVTKTTVTGNLGATVQGPRNEGYMYKPHHRVEIREFSQYIEQGDNFTEGIPDYAEDLGDGRFLWRDYLPIGSFNGSDNILDYPFTNGNHYIHQNMCLMTMRQDPYGAYGLRWVGTDGATFDPADPIGDAITDKFRVNRSDDAC